MDTVKRGDILLESGTNEFELMEFTLAGQVFGINVAKVREIMKRMPVKPMQNAHPAIEGVFKPRDQVIAVLNLASYLNLPDNDQPERDIFMITEFNGLAVAFHVHSVLGIDRISWKDIQKPDRVIWGGEEGVATGIAEFEKRLITILDFEKIIAEISPTSSIQASDIEQLGERTPSDDPILMAEDSTLLAKLIVTAMHKAGYNNMIQMGDGQDAYEYLLQAKKKGGSIFDHVSCIISDIEMPRMDGHRLTKLVKEDPVLKAIPVILFSSLINEEMRLKGKQLGADAQISKPEIAGLVSLVDRLVASTKL